MHLEQIEFRVRQIMERGIQKMIDGGTLTEGRVESVEMTDKARFGFVVKEFVILNDAEKRHLYLTLNISPLKCHTSVESD